MKISLNMSLQNLYYPKICAKSIRIEMTVLFIEGPPSFPTIFWDESLITLILKAIAEINKTKPKILWISVIHGSLPKT